MVGGMSLPQTLQSSQKYLVWCLQALFLSRNSEMRWSRRLLSLEISASLQQFVPLIPTELQWHDMLWFKEGIGKHSVCLWMALQNGLKTKDKLQLIGINSDHLCILCDQSRTLHTISFSVHARRSGANVTCLVFVRRDLIQFKIKWLNFFLKCDNSKNDNQMLANLCFPAFTWNIWKERNFRIFRNTRRPSIALANEIKQQVKARATYLNPNVSTHLQWKWDIPQYSTHRQRTWSINSYEVESWNFSYASRKSTLLASKECKVRTIFRS